MKTWLAAAALIAMAACTQPQGAAEAVVHEIYATASEHIGQSITPPSIIPMTDELRTLLERAEAAADARDEPFIEGDLVLNCQDCTAIADLVIGPQSGPYQEPTQAGHRWVQASFKLNGDEDRTILWDMVETPQGWRVDNILTEGLNLRAEAASYLSDTTAPEVQPAAP